MPYAYGASKNYSPKKTVAPKHSPHGGGPGGYVPPKKKTTTWTPGGGGGPPRVLNPPPTIPKGRTHPGGIKGIKNRNILNWLKSKAG